MNKLILICMKAKRSCSKLRRLKMPQILKLLLCLGLNSFFLAAFPF